MGKLSAIAAVVLMLALSWRPVFCAEKEFTKERVIAIATAALETEGIDFQGVEIIYDEGGRLWGEKIGYLEGEDKSPNHGILRKGFLKNYRVVYFDLKEPLKDIWVFIDKDSGEILDIYKEQ